MLLENESAVTYEGGGAIGSAVTSTFAREAAEGISGGSAPSSSLPRWPRRFSAAGGIARATAVDALDEKGRERARRCGGGKRWRHQPRAQRRRYLSMEGAT